MLDSEKLRDQLFEALILKWLFVETFHLYLQRPFYLFLVDKSCDSDAVARKFSEIPFYLLDEIIPIDAAIHIYICYDQPVVFLFSLDFISDQLYGLVRALSLITKKLFLLKFFLESSQVEEIIIDEEDLARLALDGKRHSSDLVYLI